MKGTQEHAPIITNRNRGVDDNGSAKQDEAVAVLDRTSASSSTERGSKRLTQRGIMIRLFLTCWLVYTLHFATNTVREIYPALSLGDRLSFDVTEYLGLHPDIFEIPGRGVFINNNPGASILGAIPYTLARPVIDRVVQRVERARQGSGAPPPEYDSIYPMAREFYQEAYERGFDVKFGMAAGVMQAFLMAPLSALSVVVMYTILLRLTGSRRQSVLLSLLYAFATPIFYRTAQLNHNLLQAHFAFFAFALLWRPWDDSTSHKRPNYLLAGLLAGWTVVLDYSGLIIVAAIGIYALARWLALPAESRTVSDLVRFAIGVMLSGMVLIGYQWQAFGNPILPAQHYMPTTTYSHLGYNGMDWPQLDLLWANAFGLRFGLFTSAPLLLLALYVPAWFKGRFGLLERRETLFVLLFSLAFFLFSAANQFSRMQFNTGVRHVVPVTPFLFLLAAGVMIRLPVLLAAGFGVMATYWSWCLAMYRDVELGFGIFESLIHITFEGFQLPWLNTLERIGVVQQVSPIPILAMAGVMLWILWNVHPNVAFSDNTGNHK